MPGESRVLRIGDWRVDPELDELSREGQTIRVEPRTMQLLLYLAAHAGRVVDVQQLLNEVWSNVVVTQGSVYQAVAQLRRILGDDSEHPKYIENLPRRGYRLIARVALSPTNVAPTSTVTFAPPPHSVAVLPFVNLSGDKEQEYFSDGLTEELLNSLSRINELRVVGRTSSFYFKGAHADLATITHKLNVATVLEGSVRRSADTVRVSAQLINAETGFHLWSETYDRGLADVLKLQTEIANAVTSALRITLLGDTEAKIELGGTRNPAAFDAYLRGAKAHTNYKTSEDLQAVIAAYTEAIRLDPNYALAFAGRSLALTFSTFSAGPGRERILAAAQADAQKAIALAPPMTEGHIALATFFAATLDLSQAMAEYERALTLGPGNARALQPAGTFLVLMGRTDRGIATARRVVAIDPLNPLSHFSLGGALFYARRYEEAVAAFGQVVSLGPDAPRGYCYRGFAYLSLGSPERARESCAVKPEWWGNLSCLALADDRLGRHADAETALTRLKALMGDGAAYEYAAIYAQWGGTGEALSWLETALRLRDPYLVTLKTDPRIDPVRKEPRFQAVMRELKFPG